MNKKLRILCPTDFSENSEKALTYAHALANASGGVVDCVHVIDSAHLEAVMAGGAYGAPTGFADTLSQLNDYAKESLDKLVAREHFRGVDITPHLVTGSVAEEVSTLADELEADLIVLSTHGRTGFDHLVLGSRCEKIVRTSRVPVLALKPDEREIVSETSEEIKLDTILCPLDFSDFSQSALPMAVGLAKIFGSKLVLVHVIDTRYDYPDWTAQANFNNSEHLLKSAMSHLQAVADGIEGVEVLVRVLPGIPYREIVKCVETESVDLIVMPTHGRTGLSHAFLGSVSEKVVRKAKCPVVTMRPAPELAEVSE